MQNRSYLVFGGDERMLFLADFLKENGQQVFLGGFDKLQFGSVTKESLQEKIRLVDIVVLPIPLTKNGITLNLPYCEYDIKLEELKKLLKGKRCFGGGEFSGCEGYFDLLREEWLTVHNAELTAEGAIARALANSKKSLSDSVVLVAGFGRIGKQLAMCRDLYVCARKTKDQAEIESMGCRFVHTEKIAEKKHLFDLIFSTVPAKIFTNETLICTKKGALLIDLASAGGSADESATVQHGVRLIHALSIPGKDFPQTAGRLLGQTILQFCQGGSV